MAKNTQPKQTAPAPETKPETAAAPAAPPVDISAVRVVSRSPGGFWCIARHFTREATVLPLAELKLGELEKLRASPHLVVTDLKS